jgi:acetoin:2,6-dichlorophenolindophenol oxidoreductase subunit beta
MADRDLYFIRAMYEGLRDAMREDPSVVVIGEDVDRSIIGATKGLIEEFGADRVRNTPISEATFVGACVGAAASGLRPFVDLMFSSFFYVALDQVGNQAARLRYMSGGQVELPLVYFAGTGPSGSAAAQHSENPHPILMHLSGLKVVFPSTPADAKGLLIASIRDPNPVVYLLDLMLAGEKGPVPEEPDEIELGSATVRREGADVTVVALGSLVQKALDVAGELEAEDVAVEVVDPRTLVPFDWETVVASVRKTRRLIVADPARRTCSAASEIAAGIAERCWDELLSAPQRVTWEDVPVPFSPVLEEAMTVSSGDIRSAVLAAVRGRSGVTVSA